MSEPATILVIEDEEDLQQLLVYNLLRRGYTPLCAASAEEGLAILRQQAVDLVLLDIMLPGMDGLSLLALLRDTPELARLPVIMLTARGEEGDVVAALNHGADDYVVKPFSPRVLFARLEAVLRRSRTADAGGEDAMILERHGLTLDPGRRRATIAGRDLALTRSEFDLLAMLMARPGWVFTRQHLLDRLKGEDQFVGDRLVDVLISHLRKKLGRAGELIETVRGVGYRFRE